MDRVYMNRRPGEERIHIEISADELPALLTDQGTTTAAGQAMASILTDAAQALGVAMDQPC